MTEEIEKYGDKSITYTELADFVRGICLQKVIENSHKDDLLKRSIENLIIRTGEERHERLNAGVKWYYGTSDKNALEYLREIADEIIFLQAQAGKVLGFETLIRE